MNIRRVGPEGLSNIEIKNKLEEIRSEIIEIISVGYDKLIEEDICRSVNSYISCLIWGVGVPSILTDGRCSYIKDRCEYRISILISSRELLCLGEPNYEDISVNYDYTIGSREIREYKINKIILLN